LLSRCRVFDLEPLAEPDVAQLVRRAAADRERGLAPLPFGVDDEVFAWLARVAEGDARRALHAFEVLARDLSSDDPVPERLTRDLVEARLDRRLLEYDRDGAAHYGLASAFIKSLRGSDPDAAVYYMVRMLEGGEDPRFLLRRMVIFASEDVGNADPEALRVATSALSAYELVGLPEGVLPLTQAATYLALASKSNAVLTAYGRARKDVTEQGSLPVPRRLLNPTDAHSRRRGHGVGYRYPHDFGGVAPDEHYLPEAIEGRRYYVPAESGREIDLGRRLDELLRLRNVDESGSS